MARSASAMTVMLGVELRSTPSSVMSVSPAFAAARDVSTLAAELREVERVHRLAEPCSM